MNKVYQVVVSLAGCREDSEFGEPFSFIITPKNEYICIEDVVAYEFPYARVKLHHVITFAAQFS